MTNPLAHIPGLTRRSIQQFARHYYQANTKKDREICFADWENLRRQGRDVEDAMHKVMLHIGLREMDELLEYVSLTETELKAEL